MVFVPSPKAVLLWEMLLWGLLDPCPGQHEECRPKIQREEVIQLTTANHPFLPLKMSLWMLSKLPQPDCAGRTGSGGMQSRLSCPSGAGAVAPGPRCRWPFEPAGSGLHRAI